MLQNFFMSYRTVIALYHFGALRIVMKGPNRKYKLPAPTGRLLLNLGLLEHTYTFST
jgi:hypothetical protein